MSKQMTPCEKLGYKVGDKFKVVDGTGVHYSVGSFITLIHDDGSSCPRFNGVHAIFESGDSFFPLDFVEKVAKLKPAKQALADAIHQNGGWPSDDANFAAQDKIDGESNDNTISFYSGKVKPTRLANNSMWRCENSGSHFMGYEKTISGCELIANWHQTCLSREEYYQAYPKADEDGWIEWKGGECPVGEGDRIDVKFSDGDEFFDVGSYGGWGVDAGCCSIIAYRLHKPEQADPEFCESVVRSIPEPDEQVWTNPPSIEQLASDYRNAKDYAERKQQEADDANVAAYAALGELERAGDELGLIIGVKKPTHELSITDWRDLQVGDEVECVESNIQREKYNGMVGRLHFIDEIDTSTPYLVDFGGKAKIWCHEVKFIRRP